MPANPDHLPRRLPAFDPSGARFDVRLVRDMAAVQAEGFKQLQPRRRIDWGAVHCVVWCAIFIGLLVAVGLGITGGYR